MQTYRVLLLSRLAAGAQNGFIRGRHLCIALLFPAVLLGFSTDAWGQHPADTSEAPPTERIQLRDGSSIVGRVVAETDSTLTIERRSGQRLTLERNEVVSREQVSAQTKAAGDFVRADPNDTRLFFGPTARPLGAGEGYLSVFEIVVPFVAYGIGSRTTVAGGTIPLPGVFFKVFYVAPKLTVLNRPGARAAVGVLHASVVDEGSGGIAYGVGTIGNTEAAITVGAGFAYATNVGFSDRPALILGGELQVSNSVKLISENYFVVGNEMNAILSGGVRLFGDNLAGSLGLGTSPEFVGEEDVSFPFVPILSFSYNF